MKQNENNSQVKQVASGRIGSLGIRIKSSDGTIIDLGTMTSRPIIGKIEAFLVNRKIKKYRRENGLE